MLGGCGVVFVVSRGQSETGRTRRGQVDPGLGHCPTGRWGRAQTPRRTMHIQSTMGALGVALRCVGVGVCALAWLCVFVCVYLIVWGWLFQHMQLAPATEVTLEVIHSFFPVLPLLFTLTLAHLWSHSVTHTHTNTHTQTL